MNGRTNSVKPPASGIADAGHPASCKQSCEPANPTGIKGFPSFGHVKLQGVLNCRDLGGMPASGNKHIKKRRLMRSGDLHHATSTDISQLVDMHDMDCVIDFRTDSEVEASPDPKPLLQGIEYLHLSVLTKEDIIAISHGDLASEGHLMREFIQNPFETIKGLYSKAILSETGIGAYKSFLETLLESEKGAVLWHCTQGKDRTGIGAVLVETALGVSEKDIRDDYLATNLFVGGWMTRMKKFLEDKKIAQGIEDDIEAYAYANTCYLDTVYKIVKDDFGSMEKYMEDVLDFGKDKCAKLQELYLEQ